MSNLIVINFLVCALVMNKIYSSNKSDDSVAQTSGINVADLHSSQSPILESTPSTSSSANAKDTRTSSVSQQSSLESTNLHTNKKPHFDGYYIKNNIKYREYADKYNDAIKDLIGKFYKSAHHGESVLGERDDSIKSVDFNNPIAKFYELPDTTKLNTIIWIAYKNCIIKDDTNIFFDGVIKNSEKLVLAMFSNIVYYHFTNYVDIFTQYNPLEKSIEELLNGIAKESFTRVKLDINTDGVYKCAKFNFLNKFMNMNQQAYKFLNEKKFSAPSNSLSENFELLEICDNSPINLTKEQIKSMIRKIESINLMITPACRCKTIMEYQEAFVCMLFAYFSSIIGTFNISVSVVKHLKYVNDELFGIVEELNSLSKELIEISKEFENLK